jgi:L-lactate dehydrogenase complex protein LldG
MSDDDRLTAREVILTRIREAAGPRPTPVVVPRGYRTSTPPDLDVVDRFAERVADYRAVVHRSTGTTLAARIAGALAARGARTVVLPPGLPPEWVAEARTAVEVLLDDPPLSHAQLDSVDAVVTACAVAIAETGTIVLDAGDGQGRRVLSLLPDRHVCVVRADQIVGDVPEALARLDPLRPLTWISGPSATSDIELNRVEGVHGPRNLDVVIVA